MFLKLFHILVLLIFQFNNNGKGYCDNEMVVEEKKRDVSIPFGSEKAISIDKPFYYVLFPDKFETKLEDVSVEIYGSKLNNGKLEENVETYKFNLDKDFLDTLKIMKIAEVEKKNYYILFVRTLEDEFIYLTIDENNKLSLYDKNVLTRKKIEEGVKDFNKNNSSNFILGIKNINGLKTHKDPIRLNLKKE